MWCKKHILVFYVFFTPLLFIGQSQKRIDSLAQQIKSTKEPLLIIELKKELYAELVDNGKGDSIINKLIDLEKLAIKDYSNETVLGDIEMTMGNYYLDIDLYDKALSCYLKANTVFKNNKDEKSQAYSNGRIAATYLYIGDYNKSIEYNNLAVSYYEKVKDSKSLAKCYGNLGLANKRLGKFLLAIEFQEKSYQEEKKINNKKGMASCLNAVGNIYFTQSDYPKALEKYFASLKIQQETNHIEGIANALSNIGLVFKKQKDYDKALKYSFKSLEVEKKHHRVQGEAISLSNIGDIYFKIGKRDSAIYYFNQSLEIYKNINDEVGLADIYSSIGLFYESIRDYQEALSYHTKALSIYDRLQQPDGQAIELYNLANCLANTNQIKEAISYLNKSIEISINSNLLENIVVGEELLASIYERKNLYKESLSHYKKFMLYRDSIFTIDKLDEISRNEVKFEFEKKAAEDSLKNIHDQQIKDSQIEAHELQIEKDKIKRNYLYIGIIILIVFLVIIYNRFSTSQKQKAIIEVQKIEVEKQKALVDEKQKEIQDSINYAKRIQNSFITSEEEFEKNTTDYFVYFKPKDIVSGDFYWGNTVDESFYLCVADSTGHGIPGAFMSLLNISLLNEALLSKNLRYTNEILNFVRKILILGLKTDKDGQGGNDGMDCSLISINKKTNVLEFTGANNPIWILRNDEIIELTPNKMPVGRSPLQDKLFSRQAFELLKNDKVYLFTDGLADQFGGPKGKKFKYRQFKELLISISVLPMQVQKEKLQEAFVEWKGDLEQVDDVCIMGIRI
jgi:tetratricopeptide (TPR) repeat protein